MRSAARWGLAGLLAATAGAAWAQQGGAGALPLVVGSGSGGTSYSVPIQTLLFFTALSFLPAVLLMMTGFTRIVVPAFGMTRKPVKPRASLVRTPEPRRPRSDAGGRTRSVP